MTVTIIKPAPPFETSIGNPHHIAVTADLATGSGWETVASHEVFTVTGVVRVAIWAECTEDVTSDGAATLQFGYEGVTNGLIASTVFSTIDANELWYDNTPAKINTVANVILERVISELDLGYEIGTAATTNGTIVFHCVWEPMSSDGLVTAGDGTGL